MQNDTIAYNTKSPGKLTFFQFPFMYKSEKYILRINEYMKLQILFLATCAKFKTQVCRATDLFQRLYIQMSQMMNQMQREAPIIMF